MLIEIEAGAYEKERVSMDVDALGVNNVDIPSVWKKAMVRPQVNQRGGCGMLSVQRCYDFVGVQLG
jgi:hypothetical protein